MYAYVCVWKEGGAVYRVGGGGGGGRFQTHACGLHTCGCGRSVIFIFGCRLHLEMVPHGWVCFNVKGWGDFSSGL